MNMKKWLLLAFTLVLTFTLAACGDDGVSESDAGDMKKKYTNIVSEVLEMK